MTGPARPRRSAAPSPSASPPVSRGRRVLRAALAPFWVVPGIWCLVAVLAGLTLPQVDRTIDDLPLLLESGPEGARSLLSTIAGAMISVTGLVFSITIVVLQLASNQFTPRVLRTFLDDRVTQHTLGVFAATFLYSLTVLRTVHGVDPGAVGAEARVPQLAVSLSFVLVVAAVAMFLAFIHHITSAISVTTVVGRVAAECRRLLAASADEADDLPHERPRLPAATRQHVLVAPRSGYLDLVDRQGLCARAVEQDARVEVLHPLGAFVPEGAPLAMVHLGLGDDPGGRQRDAGWDAGWNDDWDDVVPGLLVIAGERSTRQDLSFGVRRLVDIAERALSPGVNDPTTAVQVVDELHDILRRLAATPDPYPVVLDDDGVPRVVTRDRAFEDYLDLAVDEIAHYGRDSLQVPARLDRMLDDLATVDPARRGVVEAKRVAVSRHRASER